MPNFRDFRRLLPACLLAVLMAVPAWSQEIEDFVPEAAAEAADDGETVAEIMPLNDSTTAAAETTEEDAGPVEEIVVVAPRPGARRRIEFDDPERARLLRELYQSREDQAELARLAAIADEQDQRIRLGYNPEIDGPPELEEQMAIPQRETTQPATIFTIQF